MPAAPQSFPPRLLAAFLALGCGDPRTDEQSPTVDGLAQQLIPAVERAAGLAFKRPPAIALRTRDQVRSYLAQKLDADLPPEELEGVTTAYRLFGLIPDTLDLHELLLGLYTEQVVGYYDPDSATLYVVQGTDPAQLRLVLAHELVHGLQGQHLNLDSLMTMRRENDRRMAAQAVMEGQATLASLAALMPNQDYNAMPDFWEEFRRTVRAQQDLMPVFSAAPAIVREGLIFPYLAGADFVRWFVREFRDTVPFGRRLPASTEQVLHPERYREGDLPVALGFPPGARPIYDDGLGEFEIRVLLTELSGSESVGAAGALGWAGDRYGVFLADGAAGAGGAGGAGGSHALVWWTVWDSDKAAQRFAVLLERDWTQRARPERRFEVRKARIAGRAAVGLVDAPREWSGWRRVPEARAY